MISQSPHFGLELDAGYDPRLGEPSEATVTTTSAGLIYHFNPADAGVLYLAMGGGAAWFQTIDTRGNNNVAARGSAAIGAKIYFGARIILRLELRYLYAPSSFADQDLLRRCTMGIGVRF